MEKYQKGQILGQGSFGRAFLAKNKQDGKNYVIKEIDVSRMPRAEKEAAMQEVKVLQSLKHPNIVACVESFIHEGQLCIVMEWCSEGDLYNILKKRRGQLLPEETIIDWFVQICLSLKHVHDRKILHRDLKTQNIFVSSGGLLKLGDFGVAKVLGGTNILASTAVGTPYYLSPEICQNRRYNHKSDIWSLGCVLYEITTLRHAFDANSLQLLIHKIVKGQFPPISPKYSKSLRDIVNKMIQTDPMKRPSVNQLLAEPVLKTRIESFLSQSIMAQEFAHTVIHGRAGPGQLVPMFKNPPSASPSAAATPPRVSPVPSRSQSPLPAPRPADGGQAPSAQDGRRSPAPGGAAAAPPTPPPAAAAMAAAAAATPPQNHAANAWRAQHENELKRLEEERKRIEEERKKMEDARRKKADDDKKRAAAAAEDERRRAVEEERKKRDDDRRRALDEQKRREESDRRRKVEEAEAKRRLEEERRKLEEERRRLEAEDAARKKAEEKERRERERQAERDRMEQQKRDWILRQGEANRNRDKANQEMYGAGGVDIFVPNRPAPPPAPIGRAPSQPSGPNSRYDDEVIGAPPRRSAPTAAAEPTAEERRRVWEEQRAAAAANRARFVEADRGPSRPSSSPHTEEMGPSLREERGRVGSALGGGGPGPELTPEARRLAWEEMRAAADRNKRRFMEAESSNPLGGPYPEERSPPRAAAPPGQRGAAAPGAPASPGDAYLDELRREQRRIREEAARNRARLMEEERGPAVAGAGGVVLPAVSPPRASPAAGRSPRGTPQQRSPRNPEEEEDRRVQEELARLGPVERKARLQELANLRRERELKEFQRQHWREMKAAADRNKRQVLGELGKPTQAETAIREGAAAAAARSSPRGARPASALPGNVEGPSTDAEEHDASEYGRMLLEMRDVYLNMGADDEPEDDDDAPPAPQQPAARRSPSPLRQARPSGGAGPSASPGPAPSPILQAPPSVIPGVSTDSASLAARIEELRVFLEHRLGLDKFIRAYQRLEALRPEDDEVGAFTDLVGILGRENIAYLQYIHQLITCESFLNAH